MGSLGSSINQYIPEHQGLLPKWLLLISIVSVGNTVQSYLSIKFTQQVYAGPESTRLPNAPYANSPSTPLQSRTFGTWTLIQSVVRLYAAYHINESSWYQAAFITYAVAWCHFMSEWFVFKTTRMNKGLFFPILVANSTLVWMWMQWSNYVVT